MKIIITLILLNFSQNISAIKLKQNELNYFVINKTAEPFQIEEKGNPSKGIITEILNAILNESGKKNDYKTIELPFLRMLKEMEDNNKKKWINYGSKTWTGIQSQRLSKEPLFKVKHKLLTLKKTKFKTIEDLFGKRVVLITGFSYPGIMKYIKAKKIDLLVVNSHKGALHALLIGRAHAFPEIGVRALYHIKKEGMETSKFKLHDFGKYVKSYNFHLSYSLGMKEYEIRKFDQSIKRLRKKKVIRKIISKYLH
jgi:polar amino acid transport system substrate-binding protein